MSKLKIEFTDKATGKHDAMGRTQRAVKRFTDIVMALFGMIILSPIYVVIMLILKAQRNGPVIFSQERIGYKGHPFVIYKFRTMKNGFEELEPRLTSCTSKDSSTPFERFLRNHHLDELPQLWNVLIGDMSFVGPRPEREYFINKIMEHDDRYTLIYEMRPGLTSEATLYNGYTDTMEKMLKRLHMDIYYLEHRSLGVDMKIVFKTFTKLICGKNF